MINTRVKSYKFEDFLMDKFADEYVGLDDEMPDCYDEWLCDLEPEMWIIYGDLFANKKQAETIDKLGGM